MLYRICTENVKDAMAQVDLILADHKITCYTLINATGVWHGMLEDSLIIEICAEETDDTQIRDAARDIRAALKQDAVLVQRIPCTSVLVIG